MNNHGITTVSVNSIRKSKCKMNQNQNYLSTQLGNMAVARNESAQFPNGRYESSTTSDSLTGNIVWRELCENHANTCATDFAKICRHYINNNLSVRAKVSHKDFLMKFIECFSDHFYMEISGEVVGTF